MYCPSDGSKFYQQLLGSNYLIYSPVKKNNRYNNVNNSSNTTGILKTDRIRSPTLSSPSSSSSNNHHQYPNSNHHFIFDEKEFSQYLNQKFHNKLKMEKDKRLSAMNHKSVIEKLFSTYEKRMINSMSNGILIQSIKYLKEKKSKQQQLISSSSSSSNHNHHQYDDVNRNRNIFHMFRKGTIKTPKQRQQQQQPLLTIVATRMISVIPWERLILGYNNNTQSLTTAVEKKGRKKIHIVKCLMGELITTCIDDDDDDDDVFFNNEDQQTTNMTTVELMNSELKEVKM